MNIENEVFKRLYVNFEKLEDYGFVKEDNIYKYSKVFMDNLRADIEVDKNGKVSGKVYDLSIDDEYTNFRIESQIGEFVSKVRE